MLLPQIARLYSVTVDDLYREKSGVYANYAARLSSVYEATKDPEDFIRADIEFRKLLKTGAYSADDLRLYGITHEYMMYDCRKKALHYYDEVIENYAAEDPTTVYRTKMQKQTLLSRIGRGQESVDRQLALVEAGSEEIDDWLLLLHAYYCQEDYEAVYVWFRKACEKFGQWTSDARERFPRLPMLYLSGGDACHKLGKDEEALYYWDKSLELNPDLYDAKFSKGFFYEEMGAYDKAYEIWCDVVECLKREGYEAELDFPQELARKCKEKLEA